MFLRKRKKKLFCCTRIRVGFLFPVVVVVLSATDERHVSQVEVTEWEANLKQHMFSVFAHRSVKLAWCSARVLPLPPKDIFFCTSSKLLLNFYFIKTPACTKSHWDFGNYRINLAIFPIVATQMCVNVKMAYMGAFFLMNLILV